MQPGHRPSRTTGVGPATQKVGTHAPQEEGLRLHQAADPGRSGHARPARRPGPRPARRQHHVVRQGVQRRDGGPARQRHPGRDHGLRGPLVHLRDEDPAGRRAHQEGRWRRQGFRRAAQDQGRQALARPGPRDRSSEDGRPQRQRRGDGGAHHRRHRSLDGHRHRALSPAHDSGVTPAARHTDRMPWATWEDQRWSAPRLHHHARSSSMKRSKNYRAAAELVTPGKVYAPLEAVRVAKQTAKAKYDETVEVAMRLGVDPRKADQAVRGTVNLPHGTGKTARVLVFANGDKAEAAREAGADYVGSDDLLEKVQGGWLDFDAVVATPDLMGKVGRLGKVLGPRGLMPNPKTGTVTMDVAKAVADIKGVKIEFRVDKHANLHFIIGKASFDETKLVENYAAALEEILRLKPASSKGRYIEKATVSTTMGPGIPLDFSKTRNLLAEEDQA